MEYPRLRPLDFIPVESKGRSYIYVRDPLGLVPEGLLFPKKIISIIQFMDGRNSIRDIQYLYFKSTGEILSEDEIRKTIEKLDELLILDSERFKKEFEKAKKAFAEERLRRVILAGKGYPGDEAELKAFIDEILNEAEEVKPEGKIRGMIVPHIDIRLGKKSYGKAYRFLINSRKEYSCFVIIGTGHSMLDSSIALAKKDFETPLGKVECRRDIVENMVKKLGKWVIEGEIYHKNEHSVEIQTIFLKALFKNPSIVPIIAGFGIENVDKVKWREFSEALKEELEGEDFLLISSVDLSHMGPRYGDMAPMDIIDISRMSQGDRELIEEIISNNISGYLNHFRRDNNRRRICGFAPILISMPILEGLRGRFIDYGYADMDGNGSYVSFASIAFEDVS